MAMLMLLCPNMAAVVFAAASIHDVGKTEIDDRIIFKAEALDKTEWEAMRRHPVIGADMVMKNKVNQLNGDHAGVALAVLHHHERYDGTGYPDGLGGKNIPLAARIIAVADAYDAMTSDRPYRNAKSGEEALKELIRCSGKQFDPSIVEAFTNIRTAL